MKILKIVGGVTLILIALLLITSIILVKVIDPNEYKNYFVHYVYNKTGRQVNIQGKVSWSFIPWLGIDLKKITVGNPPGFQCDSFATIGELRMKVRFWPLLGGKVQL